MTNDVADEVLEETVRSARQAVASGYPTEDEQAIVVLAGDAERLKKELERAYRCIRGFWTAHEKGEILAQTPVAYHSTTIGAACRFVSSGALDGAEYFVGKPVEVLHNALNPKRVQ